MGATAHDEVTPHSLSCQVIMGHWHLTTITEDMAFTLTGFTPAELEEHMCDKLNEAYKWMESNVLT